MDTSLAVVIRRADSAAWLAVAPRLGRASATGCTRALGHAHAQCHEADVLWGHANQTKLVLA